MNHLQTKNNALKTTNSSGFGRGLSLILVALLTACGSGNSPEGPISLNSRYNDEHPALSGDGRYLTFVSNRGGQSQIALYDLQQKDFVILPKLNSPGAIAQRPSLSYTGRYLVYLTNDKGRPALVLYDRIVERSEILIRGYGSWIRNPKISPEGRYIVFETARRGQWDIEVLDRGPQVEPDIPDGSPVRLSP